MQSSLFSRKAILQRLYPKENKDTVALRGQMQLKKTLSNKKF